jgi:hypothetical protein
MRHTTNFARTYFYNQPFIIGNKGSIMSKLFKRYEFLFFGDGKYIMNFHFFIKKVMVENYNTVNIIDRFIFLLRYKWYNLGLLSPAPLFSALHPAWT